MRNNVSSKTANKIVYCNCNIIGALETDVGVICAEEAYNITIVTAKGS